MRTNVKENSITPRIIRWFFYVHTSFMTLCLISLLHVISTEVSGKKNKKKSTSRYASFQMCKLHKVYSPAILSRPRSGQVHWRGQSVFDERYLWSLKGFCMAFYNLQCDKEISCSSRPPIERYCSGFRELTVSDSPQKTPLLLLFYFRPI